MNYENAHTRARVYTHTHTQAKTLIHTYIHTQTHIHKMFFRDRRPEVVEPLAGQCQKAGSIELFKRILKTVVFSQSFNLSKYLIFLNFVTVLLPLFDLFVVTNSRLITC